ncbi:7662_t:CDS:10, partial [Racocetra fulgida]
MEFFWRGDQLYARHGPDGSKNLKWTTFEMKLRTPGEEIGQPQSIVIRSDINNKSPKALPSGNCPTEVASVCLQIASGNLEVRVQDDFCEEMERLTKKKPPNQTKIHILLPKYNDSTMDESSNIFKDLLPFPKQGRIFIGFQTHQTTGCSINVAARVIPTVERESIDLVEPTLSVYNSEMLCSAGILSRLLYENEMYQIAQKLTSDCEKRAAHVLAHFTFGSSTPNSKVAEIIEHQFFDCCSSKLSLLSTNGVKAINMIRIPDPEMAAFIKTVSVVPELVFKQCNLFFDRAEYVLKLIEKASINDVFEELKRQEKFLQFAVLRVETNVLPLKNVHYYLNIKTIPPESDVPFDVLPYSVSKAFKLKELQKYFGNWTELPLGIWAKHILRKYKLGNDTAFAENFIGILSQGYKSMDSESRISISKLLSQKSCIPTQFGLKRPVDTYFPEVTLFDDLPIFTMKDVSEDFFVQMEENVDLNKTKANVRRYLAKELYAPFPINRCLRLPVIYWKGNWIGNSDEAYSKPSDCFSNPDCMIMGFNALRKDLRIRAEELGIRQHPNGKQLLNGLSNNLPNSIDDAKMFFNYLSSRRGDFDHEDWKVLRIKREPSSLDLAEYIVRSSRDFWNRMDEDSYISILGTIAFNYLSIFKEKPALLREMMQSPILLGRKKYGDSERYELACANEIFINDNDRYRDMFNALTCQFMDQKMEEFYKCLGCQPLSSKVKITHETEGTPTSSQISDEVLERLLERVPWYYSSIPNDNIKCEVKWIEKLKVMEVDRVYVTYELTTNNMINKEEGRPPEARPPTAEPPTKVRKTDPSAPIPNNVLQNLLRDGIMSCRSNFQDSVYSPPTVNSVPESHCDSVPETSLKYVKTEGEIEIHVASSMDPSSIKSDNMTRFLRDFIRVLVNVAEIFEIPRNKLNIFYDLDSTTFFLQSYAKTFIPKLFEKLGGTFGVGALGTRLRVYNPYADALNRTAYNPYADTPSSTPSNTVYNTYADTPGSTPRSTVYNPYADTPGSTPRSTVYNPYADTPSSTPRSTVYNPYADTPSSTPRSTVYNPYADTPSSTPRSTVYNPYADTPSSTPRSTVYNPYADTPPSSTPNRTVYNPYADTPSSTSSSTVYNPYADTPSSNTPNSTS